MVLAVIVMKAGHLSSLIRCMAKSLLSHIPCKDIRSMLLPPILFHLPTQVYSMQSIIVHNMSGSSYANPNCRRTRSRWCVSTMQKHTSGTLAIHVSLPTTQKSGRWLKSALYGCHIIYNKNKKQLS